VKISATGRSLSIERNSSETFSPFVAFYPTLLVDTERSRPVGLLPDREAATLVAWLKGQPGIEVATRDRATFYAEGLTQGAPAVIQVADRWYLLKNLSDAVERVGESSSQRTTRSGAGHQSAAPTERAGARRRHRCYSPRIASRRAVPTSAP
jgi:transposase